MSSLDLFEGIFLLFKVHMDLCQKVKIAYKRFQNVKNIYLNNIVVQEDDHTT